ncbi:MAG: hypothetical protein KGN01_07520 [Patescibacteria group bacterium]|nr:hypothetical protein [Patescibacteria group bacterium]
MDSQYSNVKGGRSKLRIKTKLENRGSRPTEIDLKIKGDQAVIEKIAKSSGIETVS